MTEDYRDPSGNTEMFQAFVDQPEPVSKSSNLPMILGIAAVVVLAVGVLGWAVSS